MGVYGGPEGAARSLAATLQAHLGAAIDAIWAAAGSTIAVGNRTLAVPVVKPDATKGQLLAWQTDFPAEPQWVMVYPTDGDYVPGQEPLWNELRHTLAVDWAVTGDNDAVLQAQCARWQQAIFWTIQKYKTLDGLAMAYNAQPGRYRLSDPFKHPKRGGLCRAGRMPVVVMAEETIPF